MGFLGNRVNQTDSKQVEEAKPKISKKRLLFFLAFSAVIITTGVTLFLIYWHQKAQGSQVEEKLAYQKMIKDTNQASAASDNYRIKSITEAYLKNPPKNEKYRFDAEIRLTQSCLLLELYTCANDAGKKAIKLDPAKNSYSIYELMGDTNYQLKNYDDAVNYYKKAIEIINNSKDIALKSRINRLNSEINYINNVAKKK